MLTYPVVNLGQPMMDTQYPSPPPQPVIQCKPGGFCPSPFCMTIGPVSAPDLKKVSDMLQAQEPGKFWIYPRTAMGPGDQDYVVWCNAYAQPVQGAMPWSPPAATLPTGPTIPAEPRPGCQKIGIQGTPYMLPDLEAKIAQAEASGLEIMRVPTGRIIAQGTRSEALETVIWGCPKEGAAPPGTPAPAGRFPTTTVLAVGGGLTAAALLAALAFR